VNAHPLIVGLFTKHGYQSIDATNIDAFAAAPGFSLLLFTEDPMRVRETLDLAVIVPEIARTFAGRMRVGVLLPEAARDLHARYGFRRWPAFVVLRDGQYIGAVDGLRDWNEYVQTMNSLLVSPPVRPPSIGVAVTAAKP
jgi:hydrogenase-1 operon protein HyaE